MRSYKDLEREVWLKNRCSGCGACTAVCPANNLYFKEESPVKFNCTECYCEIVPPEDIEHPISAEFCKTTVYDVPCGACHDACPRVEVREMEDKYLGIYRAKSKLEIKNAQNGGVVSAILINALEEELIDGAIVIKQDNWTLEPISYLATTKEEVVKAAGSKYLRKVSPLNALKKAVMEEKLERLAIVGTPCIIEAMAKIQSSVNDLLKPFRKAIRLKISLFCFEIYDYAKMLKKLEEEGINPWDIKKMEIERGKFLLYLVDGFIKEYKIKELDPVMREGCKSCIDFTGLYSDISVGNVGTPEGYSTVIIRNKWGEGFFKRACYNGLIDFDSSVKIEEIKKLAELKMKRKNYK
ncbi:coenzyme F420 hydrogenase/dehydrogenase beta subunit domain protein [Methanocaldococcus infernus ME]|uniref:Coenzyme F420 hydrogenase/dehydrogenase beta subunit domain protein n=1 Tax=Methanocaldococcus infernus (strain DSM 11812 / JCM 15783 / ME) TaxID=573063 RepID=D5VSI0_METIM|nr:Coenzyme F420 hydrogenase/dehydrogenase, beta subunit C-terminal domain [Methanocaldococcus infernus]ADG13533.1 coenzyme F420 hydrogenase/dehydrogenase beta subunit domain protein [Methanocaldococcus infernus ME]